MASIFLSYAREDLACAEKLAHVLESAGHSVWWDRRLDGGVEFSAEIEEALDRSDVILVAWSRESVKSRWVRDEAATGGDTGRLFPISIDGSPPPMGFRQFHTLDLSNWKGGERDERTAVLLQSVERRLKGSGNAIAAISTAQTRRRVGFSGANRIWAAAAIAVALLAIAAFFFASRTAKPENSAASVALLPFTADSSDADARKLAAATRDAVAHTTSQSAFAVITIDAAPQGGRAPADFLISGHTSRSPDKVVITVRMEETAHHIEVLSRQFEASREKAWDLPERVGAQMATALSWIAPLLALERRHPDPAITAPFLQMTSAGFDSLGDLHVYQESRRMAAKAPNSPLAQYNLAFMTPWVLYALPREDRAQAVAAARRAADRSLRLAPEFGGAYLPWCLLHSEQRRVQCEDRLRAGMRADPDNPLNSWFLSKLLNEVGRNREAADLAALSLAHDQYIPFKIGLMLRMLEISGETTEAVEIYQRSAHWWPGDGENFWYRASGMLLRGDFEAAQRFKREVTDEVHSGYQPVAGLASALRSNSTNRVESVCAKIMRPSSDGRALQCMFGLAQVGDLDGAYRIADAGMYPGRRGRTPAEEERIWLDNPGPPNPVVYLTGPVTAPFRRDRRYVALAERVGLLEYWRSGRPPDFCRKDAEPICTQLLKRN